MADGTAMNMVEIMNVVPNVGFMPLMNMWCPHTTQPSTPMPRMATTMDVYPKIGLRDALAMMSDATPIPGRMRI